jgi:hypothetical protein
VIDLLGKEIDSLGEDIYFVSTLLGSLVKVIDFLGKVIGCLEKGIHFLDNLTNFPPK